MQKLGGLIRKSSNPPSLTLISLPCNNARVVVCFCEGRTVRGLLAAIRANKLEGLFHIMGRYGNGADYQHFLKNDNLHSSDGWADRADVIQGLETAAVGKVLV